MFSSLVTVLRLIRISRWCGSCKKPTESPASGEPSRRPAAHVSWFELRRPQRRPGGGELKVKVLLHTRLCAWTSVGAKVGRERVGTVATHQP
jgi:hypothetical protein